VSGPIVTDESVRADFAPGRYPKFPDPSQEDLAFRLRKPTQRSSPPAFLATLTVVVLFATSTWTQAANYYIRAAGPLGNGSGSSAANAADASTAAKYDAIVNAQNTPGEVIFYTAGTYPTSCRIPANNGVTHQGAGIGKTIIQIANGACTSGVNAGSWLFLGQASPNNHFACYDMTIDFNTANQPAWTNQLDYCTVAFGLYTPNNCTIQRVKFINLASQNYETFVIFFSNGGANGNCFNNLIDSCIFTQPMQSGNVNSGMTVIYEGDWLPNISVDNTNVVSNCQFLNLKYPAFSDIAYCTCVTGPVVENCYASGIDGLWGCEPGSQGSANNGGMYVNQTCQVTGNILTNCGRVGGVLLHPNASAAFGSVNIQNNLMFLDQIPYQYYNSGAGPTFMQIQLTGGNGTSPVGTITVENNTVIAPPAPWNSDPALFLATCSGSELFRISALIVENNKMYGFPGSADYVNITTSQVTNYTKSANVFETGTPPTIPPMAAIVSPPGSTYTPSPNDTVVTKVGPTITDSSGNVWALTAGGQVSLNGAVLSYTANVVELAYVSGTVWQLNAGGNWYSFTSTGALGAGPTTASPLPKPTPTPVSAPTPTPVPKPTPTPVPKPTPTPVPAPTPTPVPKPTPSTNGTVVATVGPTITDALGNVWAITSGAQVSRNGAVVAYTANVIELAYVNGVVWQLNASENWYSFTPTGALGIGPTSTSPLSAQSPKDTAVTTVGPGITDSALNVWELTSGGQVSLNGAIIAYTANVVEMAYVNGTVWQSNASGNWYSFTPTGALGLGPTITSPLPTNQ
jgi:hypothetical protein